MTVTQQRGSMADAGNEVDPKILKTTQKELGKIVKKPPLTEKLLSKPPFRFLHDVVMAVIKNTGVLQGLYTDTEMNAANVKDKEAKIEFLDKLIACLVFASGLSVSCRSSKIVTGQEADKTNELLHLLAKVGNEKINTSKAVERVLAGERPKKDKKDKKGKESEKSQKSTPSDKKEKREAKDSPDSKPKKTTTPGKKDRERDKEKDSDKVERKKRDTDSKTRKKDDEKSSHKSSDKPDKSDRTLSSKKLVKKKSRRKDERDASKDSKLRKKDQISDKDRDRATGKKDDGGDRDDDGVHITVNEEVSAAQDDPVEALPNGTVSPAALELGGPSGLAPRHTAAHPGRSPTTMKGGTEHNDVGTAGKVEVIVDDDKDDEDDFVVQEASLATADMADVTETGPQSAGGGGGLLETGEHGGLVQKMLQTKEQLQHGSHLAADDNKSTRTYIERSGADAHRAKERQMVQREIEKLRGSIQTLCRSANPLGKIMDYIQEDLDSMQKELETWIVENKDLNIALKREDEVTEKALEPLQTELKELEHGIADKQALIASVKARVLRNDLKIQKMMGSVTNDHR